MKLLLRTLLALAPVALSAQTVVGSPHDLRPLYTGTGATTQVCIFCHTPHNAAASTAGPLWNHTPSAVASYTVYTSGSMTQTAGQPGAQSKACLSCHDGTVAVGSIYNNGTPLIMGTFTVPAGGAAEWSGAGLMTAANPARVGTDLSNDHPIAVIYPNAGNAGFKTGTAATTAGVRLYGATFQVECASCHAVHDNTNAPFLRINNTNSALCTACHIK